MERVSIGLHGGEQRRRLTRSHSLSRAGAQAGAHYSAVEVCVYVGGGAKARAVLTTLCQRAVSDLERTLFRTMVTRSHLSRGCFLEGARLFRLCPRVVPVLALRSRESQEVCHVP